MENKSERKAVKFVVLSMPRTGSNMLTQWLSTHNEIRCLPAIFTEAGWPSPHADGFGVFGWMSEALAPEWERLEARVARPNRLIREIVAKSPSKQAVGFKHHLGDEDITNMLFGLGPGVRKVILTRNNLLAAYSSNKVAQLTGQGTARARTSVARALVTFECEEFERFVEKRNRLYVHARAKVRQPRMEIDYTAARTEQGVAEIARFLRVDRAGFGTQQTVKRNSDDIVSRFDNPDAVRSYLRENGPEDWATEN